MRCPLWRAKNENDFIFNWCVTFGRIISVFCGNLADWMRNFVDCRPVVFCGRCCNGGKIKPKPPEKIEIFDGRCGGRLPAP